MKNYELRIKLQYLTLAGKNEKGELEWIGTNEEWNTVESYLIERERLLDDIDRRKEIKRTIEDDFSHLF